MVIAAGLQIDGGHLFLQGVDCLLASLTVSLLQEMLGCGCLAKLFSNSGRRLPIESGILLVM